MIGTSDLEFAKEFSKRIHKGQVDKAGEEYWKHPYAVADLCETEKEKIVAYLHDVVEDTDIHLGQIWNMFGDEICDAVNAITHNDGVPYMDNIKKLASNRIARKVKIADLTHNMDLSRLKEVTENDIRRNEKYLVAKAYLEGYDDAAQDFCSVEN